MAFERHELCVIGAGTAGFAAAEAARASNRDVVLIAGDDELGGTCIRRGCMPAKALLAATEIEGTIEKAREIGVETGPVHVDVGQIVRRKRALVDYFTAHRAAELAQYPVVRGNATFVARDAIAVNGRRIRADRFVIATGARNDPAAFPQLGGIPTITSTGVLELTDLPHAIAILGGGPVGCSFAQYFARLGTAVTLIQDAPELLRNDDRDVGAAVRGALTRDGVDVILDVDFDAVRPDGAAIVVEHPNARRRVSCDVVMIATHRRPAIRPLNLAAAGIASDERGCVRVDATLRSVSTPGVFAAGDVLGRRALVHAARYAGRLAAENAFAARRRSADWDLWEAHAVATDPEVAVLGLTESACRARGIDVVVARLGAGDIGKAVVADETDGFVKMLARRDDRSVIGAAIVCAGATELAGEAIACIARGATVPEIAQLPHLHPTMSELWAEVAEKLSAAF